MRYPAVISAVFIAAAAAPALAAPSGLGVRAVEEDALVQRSFDDELYARDLIFGRADKPDKSHRHYGSLPVLHLPRPPPRGKSPSKDLGHPKPVPSAKASAPPKQREARDLGVRAVEEDALAQRSFDDELYARDLIFGRTERPVRPKLQRGVPYTGSPAQRPPKWKASSELPRPPPNKPPGPAKKGLKAQLERRELDELYVRGLMARGRNGPGPSRDPRRPIDPHPAHSKPPPHPRQRRPSDTPAHPPKLPVTGGDAKANPRRPEKPRELDELYARDLMGELFARALEDVVFARMDADDLD